MGSIPVLKPNKVASILERLGFLEVRQKGSHKQFRHPDVRESRGHSILLMSRNF